MSIEIDRRVVEMQFDNRDFERNVQKSLSTLEKLKMALNFDGAKGLDKITKAANKVDMSNITEQTDKVREGFSALEIAGYTMISELTKSFMNFGKKLWDISFGQMKSGGMARALKIEQANFQMRALIKNMQDVTDQAQLLADMGKAIDEAVNGTAYGYDAAAAVTAQLMASGMHDADQMYEHLRAIAGAAAMTGASFEEIGHIFTTVASNGRLMGDQLMSFSVRGMNLSALLADELGKTEQDIRKMITNGQISFEEFSRTLFEAYGDAAGSADDMYAGVLSNVKAQLSRLGQRFAEPYIRNMIPFLKQLKVTIKGISSTLVPIAERYDIIFGKLTEWGAKVLADIDYRRFTTIFRGIENIAYAIAAAAVTLKEAFQAVFPAKTREQLYEAAKAFEALTEQLFPTREALEGLKGLFMLILTPVKVVVKVFSMLLEHSKPIAVALARVAYAFMSIFSVLVPIVNEIVEFIDKMGVLDAILDVVSKAIAILATILSMIIQKIAEITKKILLSDGLKNIVKAILNVADALANFLLRGLAQLVLFLDEISNRLSNPGMKTSQFVQNMQSIGAAITGVLNAFAEWLSIEDSMSGLKSFIRMIGEIFGLVKNILTGQDITGNVEGVSNAFTSFINAIKSIGETLKNSMSEITVGKVLLFSFAIVIMLFISALKDLSNSATKALGVFTSVPKAINNLAETIEDLQTFAGPILFLLTFGKFIHSITNAIKVLSEIPKDQLIMASVALASITAITVAAYGLLMLLNSNPIAMPEAQAMAVGILSIAASMAIMQSAFKNIYEISNDIEKTISAIAVMVSLMVSLAVSLGILGTLAPGLSISALSILSFASSIALIVFAFKSLVNIDYSQLSEYMPIFTGLMLGFAASIAICGKYLAAASLPMIGFVISLFALVNILKLIAAFPMDMVTDAVKKLTYVMSVFIPLFIAIGLSMRIAKGGATFGGTIWALVLAISAYLVALTFLANQMSKINNMDETINRIKKLVDQLLIWVGVFTFLVGVFVFIDNFIPKATSHSDTGASVAYFLDGMKKVISSMAWAILSIGIAAKLAENTDVDSINALTGIVGIMGGFILAIMGVAIAVANSKGSNATMTQFKNMLGPFIAALSMLTVCIGALAILQFANPDQVKSTSMAIFAICAGIAAIIAAVAWVVSSIPPSMPSHTASKVELDSIFISLGAMLAGFALVMFAMKDASGWKAFGVGIALATLIGIIGKIIYEFANIPSANFDAAKRGMTGVLAMTGVLIAIGAMLAFFAKMHSVDIKKGIAFMGITTLVVILMTGLVVLLEVLNKKGIIDADKLIGIAGSIALACVGVLLVAASIRLLYDGLKDVDYDALSLTLLSLLSILGTIGLIVGVFSAIGKNDPQFLGNVLAMAGAIAIAAAACIALAQAVIMLSTNQIDTGYLWSVVLAFITLVGVLTLLGAAVGTLFNGAMLPGLITFSGVLIAIGIAAKLLAGALYLVSQSLSTFADVTKEDIGKIVDNIVEFINKFDKIADALKENRTKISYSFFLVILEIGKMIGVALGSVVAILIEMVVGFLMANLATLLEGIALIVDIIADFLLDPNTQLVISKAFYAIGLTAANAFIAALAGIGDAIVNWVVTTFGKPFADFILRDISQTNKDVAQGVYKTALSNARAYIEGLRDGLDEETLQGYLENYNENLNYLLSAGYDFSNIGNDISNNFGLALSELTEEQLTMVEAAFGNINMDIVQDVQESAEMLENATSSLPSAMSAAAATAQHAKDDLDVYTDALMENSEAYQQNTHDATTWADTLHYTDAMRRSVVDSYKDGGSEIMEKLTFGVKSKSELFRDAISDACKEGLGVIKTFSKEIEKSMPSSFGEKSLQNMVQIQRTMTKATQEVNETQQAVAEQAAEVTALSGGEAFDIDSAGKSLSEWWTDARMTVSDFLDNYSFDDWWADIKSRGTDTLNNVLQDTFGTDLDTIGRSFWSAEQWTEYGNEYINVSQQALDHMTDAQKENYRRWHQELDSEGKAYESIDDYVNRNSKFGFSSFMDLFGIDISGDEISETIKDIIDDMSEASGGVLDAGEAADEAAKRIENLRDKVAGCLDIFSEFNREVSMSSKDVLRNFMSQIEGVSDWTNELTELAARGLSDSIISDLEEAGPASYDKVHAIYQMTNRDIAILNALQEDSLHLTKESIDAIDEARIKAVQEGAYSDINDMVDGLETELEQAVESEEDDIRKVMANYGHSAIEALRAQFKFEDAINAVKAFRDELSETLKSSLKLFDDYEEDEEVKSDKLLWNMIENTKKVGRWATNMSKLAGRGLSEGLLAELKELGPEGSAKVEAFLRMTDDQLARANRAYESSTGLPDYAADKMASAYAKAGYYTSLGFAEGIDPEAAIAVMEQLATKSLTSLEEALDINSPSRKTYQDGVYAIQGFVLGLQDEESMTNLNDAIVLLADAIDKDFTDTLTKSRFMTIAANCLSGLKQGFNKNIKMVVDSVNTVSNAVLNTFRSKLKINSPSEEFAWCAEMCNLGFAEGMSNDTSAVTATEQKADDIFTAMYDKMYAVGLGLGSNDIFNPVITPVLNMSDVQSGFKSIKDYIGAEKFSVNGTVNKAVTTQNGLSKDAMVISASIDSMNSRIEALSSRMSAIGSDIEQMRYAIADGVPLYLDTGAMVGQIAGPMDKALGSRVIRAKRGKG